MDSKACFIIPEQIFGSGRDRRAMVRLRVAGALLSLVLVSAPAVAADDNWQPQVASALGKPGTQMPGGVYRVALPRTDLKVDARRRRLETGLCARRLARL